MPLVNFLSIKHFTTTRLFTSLLGLIVTIAVSISPVCAYEVTDENASASATIQPSQFLTSSPSPITESGILLDILPTASQASTSHSLVPPTPDLEITRLDSDLEENVENGDTDSSKSKPLLKPRFVWNRIKELLQLRTITLENHNYQLNEPVVVSLRDFQAESLRIKLLDARGKSMVMNAETADGALLIFADQEITPGWYTLQVYEADRLVFSQDLSWGVLAINPNQAMYMPNQTSQIAMAVLNEQGAMVCDAQLTLVIEQPEHNIKETLSTENGQIRINPECHLSQFTLRPDYEASYRLTESGTYTLQLTAITERGTVTVNDTIVVQETLPFQIERVTATRIYPPESYPVTILITPQDHFAGFVEETIPASFDVIEHNADQILHDPDTTVATLRWSVDWQAGKPQKLEYQFKAPQISPEFYLLGPLTFKQKQQLIPETTLDDVHIAVEKNLVESQDGDMIIIDPVLDAASESAVDASTMQLDTQNTVVTTEEIIFQEARQWQIAADAIYNVLAFWDGASPPTGWSCVSCLGTDTYYQIFPRGAATSGGTGGLQTHSHGMTLVSHTNASAFVSLRSNTVTHAVELHTHGWSGSTTGTASNLPVYRDLKIIKYDTVGVPTAIPNGLILIFDATPADAGWTRYSAQDNQFVRGENSATTTGGADSHIHTAGGSLIATTDAGGAEKTGASAATAAHTHTVSGNTSSTNNLPDRVDVLLYKNTSGADKYFIGGEIVMVEGTIGTNWTSLSETGGDFYQRFLRGSSTYGTTAGAATHAHTNASITSGVPSSTSLGDSKVPYGNLAGSSHTHSVTLSFDTQPHLPPYRDVVIAKKTVIGSPPTTPTIESNLYYDKAKITDTTPSLRFSSTDSENDELTYQVQISTDPSFTTNEIDAVSETDLGFANETNGADLDPFTAGDTMSYTVQAGDALTNGSTYYYQFRALDRAGTDTWSAWSDQRSITIDTSLNNGNAWYETRAEQFESDTLGGNSSINYTSDFVEASSSTGTILSTPIVAAQIQSGETTWGYFTVGDDQTTGSIIYQVFYDNTGTPTIIPDGALAGNSTGFDGSTPVDLSGLSTTTYATIYLKATLTYASGSPQLQDWHVSFGSLNADPNDPSSLSQKQTNQTVLNVGDWTNEASVVFGATVSDTDNPDTLQLCVEVQPLATSFTGTETGCGTGVLYEGTAVAASVTVSSLNNHTQYHWQARTKDSFGAYSGWVSYGANAESVRDFGVDTTSPTNGTVYDGDETGVDTLFNNGSLSSLSANWSGFDASTSGLSYYEYALGTTVGGTELVSWTNVTTDTSVTVNSLSLQTSQLYYFTIRATDLAGNTSAGASSNGQLVAPTLSFQIAPSTISFSQLGPSNDYTATDQVTLTTSTNAYGGYIVRAYTTDLLTAVENPVLNIPNFSAGSYGTPAAWGTLDIGFGYYSTDTLIQAVNLFNDTPCLGGGLPPCYAPFSQTAPGDIVADHVSGSIGSPISNEVFTINLRVTTGSTQPAANYKTTIIYTATPIY